MEEEKLKSALAENTKTNTSPAKPSDPVSDKLEKSYTQTELFTYCGISGLLGTLLGYFIGENRGEKKAKEHYEDSIKKWRLDKNKDLEKEFVI